MLFGYRLEVGHDFAGEGHDIDPLYMHLHLPVLNLAEVQDLVDKPQHAVRVPLHDLQLLAGVVREFGVLQDILHGAGNQGERGAQFVGDVGKEAQLHVCQLLLDRHFVLQAVNGKQDIYGCHDNHDEEKGIQEVGERSLPERGQDLDVEHARVFGPDAVSVGGTYLEDVVSFRQVGVGGGALLAYGVPVLLETLQRIGILDFGRGGIIEGGKLYREDILLVRQDQPFRVVQGLAQHGAPAGQDVLVGYQQFGKHDGGHIVALGDGVGVEAEDARAGSEEDIARSGILRGCLAESCPEEDLLVGIVLKPLLGGDELADPVFGAHPEVSVPVLAYGEQDVGGKPVGDGIGLERGVSFFVQRRQFVQSAAEGGDEKVAAAGGYDPVHVVVAQAVFIVRDAEEVAELHVFGTLEALVNHQRANGGADPKVSLTVARDEACLRALVDGVAFEVIPMVDEAGGAVRIGRHVVYAAGKGGDPDATLAVFVDAVDVVVAQAVDVLFPVPVAGELVAVGDGGLFGLHQSVAFGGDPEVLPAVLQDEVYVATHRESVLRHGARLGQVAFVGTVLVVEPQFAILEAYPQVEVGVFADGTYFVAQRFVVERRRSDYPEL